MIKAVGKKDTQLVEEKYALKGLYPGERLSTAGKKFLFSATGQSCLEGSPRKEMFLKNTLEIRQNA